MPQSGCHVTETFGPLAARRNSTIWSQDSVYVSLLRRFSVLLFGCQGIVEWKDWTATADKDVATKLQSKNDR